MHTHPQTLYISTAFVCALIASMYDLRTRRIPNKLTFPAILFGLVLHFVMGGPAELGYSALAGLIAGGLFLVFFVAGGMGAGDVKLMTAVGCIAGTGNITNVLIATVVIGGAMGLALAIYRGRLKETLGNVGTLVKHHSAVGLNEHPELNVRNTASLRLPYALPIAGGCLLAFMLVTSKGLVR